MKPRIKLLMWWPTRWDRPVWHCSDGIRQGLGFTPADAYRMWLRMSANI